MKKGLFSTRRIKDSPRQLLLAATTCAQSAGKILDTLGEEQPVETEACEVIVDSALALLQVAVSRVTKLRRHLVREQARRRRAK